MVDSERSFPSGAMAVARAAAPESWETDPGSSLASAGLEADGGADDAPGVRRHPWAVLLLTVLTFRYLAWRIGDTLNLADPLAALLSLLMLGAELALIGHGLLMPWLSLALPGHRSGPLQPPPDLPGPFLPTVDVLVPTYGEPPDLVARCLRGCLALDPPATTIWLLDDSGREELRELAHRLGCRYLAREERLHAKAGNLNHALEHCRGDLVLVFDADVVPLENFLRRTMPFFRDPAVGFVQTPQHYRNADPVMRNLQLEAWLMPDEECFYRWIEPVRHAIGAIVCAGTSFVVRRSALDRVGGFETATPSEDLATGIRLTAAGYRNIFLDEKLSAGLAPLTAAAMARQRCRWAGGTLQTLRTGASPLGIPGLTLLQRLAYLEGILHWLLVVPLLLLVLMPLAPGLFGVMPVLVQGQDLLTVALPFALAHLLLARTLSGGSRNALLPELYRWIFLVPLVATVLRTLAGRPPHFTVTPKAQASGRRVGFSRRLVLPLLFLLSLQLVALLHLWPGLFPRLTACLDPLSPATRGLAAVWGGLQALLLLLALRACFDRGGRGPCPWFALRLPVTLQGAGGRRAANLMAIAEEGVELELEVEPERQPQRGSPPKPEPGAAGRLQEPEPGGRLALEGLLPGQPLPLRVLTTQRDRSSALRIAATWDDLPPERSLDLERLIAWREGLWPRRSAPFEPRALLAVGLRLLRTVPPEGPFRRSLILQRPPQARPHPWLPMEESGNESVSSHGASGTAFGR